MRELAFDSQPSPQSLSSGLKALISSFHRDSYSCTFRWLQQHSHLVLFIPIQEFAGDIDSKPGMTSAYQSSNHFISLPADCLLVGMRVVVSAS